MKSTLSIILILLFFISCKKQIQQERTIGVVAQKAMVVSAREEASQIGIDILKQGGNAFDAMVATELALAVAYPIAGNIGGGGFMVYRKANGETGALDYREKAPIAASEDMYVDEEGNLIPDKSTVGAMAVGVPGTIAGVFEAHKKFGSLPIEQILQPVINLAKRGVVITEKQFARIEEYKPDLIEANKDDIPLFKNWKIGDTIKYQALASTLERIMENGRDEFYGGKTAKEIVRFIQANGGIISMDDLRKYKAVWREPVTFNYDDLKIISMSPPSSGGICLSQIMKMIENFPLDEYGVNSSKAMQVVTEAERRSYADRSFYLGDPDFVDVPVEELLEKEYLKDRMNNFSFKKATNSKDINYGNIEIVESEETTHYSIVDAEGNAVSVTTTLNGAYGSKLYSNKLGFFFNNEMDDFSAKPGAPNLYGLIGAEANAIAPGKRMLSSMTPTIVEKNGALYLVVGTPGGATIITSVLQTILNIHEFNMSAQEAINSPRFHHQWLPDRIYVESDRFEATTLVELNQLGYAIDDTSKSTIGKVEAILVLPDGTLEGAADPRGDDKAIGF